MTVRMSVRGGRLVDTGSWLYVWCRRRDGRVVYVGATGLPPVVRTWLHLNGTSPEVARVRATYQAWAEDDLEVVAVELPEGVDRSRAKAELVRRLHGAGLLSASGVGDTGATSGPASPNLLDDDADAEVTDAVARLLDLLQAHDGLDGPDLHR